MHVAHRTTRWWHDSDRPTRSVNRARLLVGLSALVSAVTARRGLNDWSFFLGMGRNMFETDGFSVYSVHPDIQSGPLSLAAVRLLSVGLLGGQVTRSIVFAGLGMLTFECLLRVRRRVGLAQSNVIDLPLVVGSVIMIFWWSSLKTYGHLDDALVLAAFAVALLLVTKGLHFPAALVLGLALAVKPWSIFLVPLTARREDFRRGALPAPVVSLVAGGLIWAPFVLTARKTLDGMRPSVILARDSVLQLFHLDAVHFPAWLRIAQLGAALAVAAVAVTRGRHAGALLGGVAVRVATDPATWPYYSAGLIVGALAWDLGVSRRRLPVMTLLLSVLLTLAPAWVVPDPNLRALMRLVACLIAVAVVIWPERSSKPATADVPSTVGPEQCLVWLP